MPENKKVLKKIKGGWVSIYKLARRCHLQPSLGQFGHQSINSNELQIFEKNRCSCDHNNKQINESINQSINEQERSEDSQRMLRTSSKSHRSHFVEIMTKTGSGKIYEWMLYLGGNSDEDICWSQSVSPLTTYVQ